MTKVKVAISLQHLLQRNKDLSKSQDDVVNSHEKIAQDTEYRRATITDAFGGKTNSRITTVIAIINALGFNLSDFAAYYDNISEVEISSFIQKRKDSHKIEN